MLGTTRPSGSFSGAQHRPGAQTDFGGSTRGWAFAPEGCRCPSPGLTWTFDLDHADHERATPPPDSRSSTRTTPQRSHLGAVHPGKGRRHPRHGPPQRRRRARRPYLGPVVIEVESRVLHLLGVTRHPAEARVTQVVSSFTADLEDAGRQIRFLVRDRTPSSPDAFGAV